MAYVPFKQHEAVIGEMARALVRGFSPLALILFGSQGRGDADEFSDVDFVAVVDTADPEEVERDMRRELARFELDTHLFVRTPQAFLREGRIPGASVYPAAKEGRYLHEWPNWRSRFAVDTPEEEDRMDIMRREYAQRAQKYLDDAVYSLKTGAYLRCRDLCRYAAVVALKGLHVRQGAHPPRDIDISFQFAQARSFEPGLKELAKQATALDSAAPGSLYEAQEVLALAEHCVASVLDLYFVGGES